MKYLFNLFQVSTAMLVFLQIVSENLNKSSINIVELSDNDEESAFGSLTDVFKMIPTIKVQYKIIKRDHMLDERVHFLTDVDVLLVTDLSKDDKVIKVI